jgi:hypothetical protein
VPKRSSKKRQARTRDENQAAFDAVQHIIALTEAPEPRKKNKAAVALGRLGGLKGGKARAAKLSAKRRSEIAKAGAAKRWKKA